ANERVAMLEKQVADLQALLTIKDKTLAGLQDSTTATTEPAPETAPQPEANVDGTENTMEPTPNAVVTESGEATEPVTKPVAKKKPIPTPEPVAQPSLLDDLMANGALMWAAIVALALLIGGWLFLRNRRKHNLDSFEQGILTAGGLKANTVFGNTSGGTVDTGDTSFLTDFSQSPSGMIDTHDVDPIAEAEVYMAYGRDSQAEEILNDAISKEPTRYELHLKLLEIFAGRNDTSAFEAVAGELYSTLGSSDPVWIKVAELGKKLEPSNPLYDLTKAHVAAASIESAAASTTVMSMPVEMDKLDASDFDNAEVMTASSLDFSLDAESGISADDDQKLEDKDSSLDFDLGFDSNTDETSVSTEEVSIEDTVQFESDRMQDSALDFDMDVAERSSGSSENSMSMTSPELESTDSEQRDQFEEPSFTETLPNLELPETSAAEKPNSDLSFESDFLDIGNLGSSTETKPSDDADLGGEKEESSGLDFNFDLGDETETSDAKIENLADLQETGANSLEMDLSGISLDMDEPDIPSEVEEITITHDESEDVNTKLDLVTAYMDMGDTEGARELLDEVLKEGGAKQRERAQELLNTLS
ncbi:MAG: FimV/HubP family polar landmark protein, partial [Nitrosomonadales bacterium]|nr:FimV/HubP family polar landmark protein [Nitrosomonadales bacterium]